MDLIQYIGSIGGIAGILAVIIFQIYRQDRKASEDRQREDRKFMEDRMATLANDYNEICSATKNALLEQTKVQSELYTWLKAKNGHG